MEATGLCLISWLPDDYHLDRKKALSNRKEMRGPMKILVVGQGGREHALVWKLSQSPTVEQVYCAPGNTGTAIEGTNVDISSHDIVRLLKFAQTEEIALTVVGPEVPLVAGIVDRFQEAGLVIFGPSSKAAELEGSKILAKKLMKKAKIPTADFQAFYSAEDALAYLEEREIQSCVVKADGLAAGKGVAVCRSKDQAKEAVRLTMAERAYGEAGSRIVIEELLVGQEVSILAIVDGNTIVPLETSQDHKAAYDGDTGPNTGGMGAYSPTPLIDSEMMDTVIEKILVPTVHTLKKEGRPFRGLLYAGLMLTNQGPKVLEFNVRFGDPEAQPILMRLKSDLAQLLLAAAKGNLKEWLTREGEDAELLSWDPRPAVCVVMAADGYPGSYRKGSVIRGLEDAQKMADVKVFHAGTTTSNGSVVTNGGRVLGVTAIGKDIMDAKLKAYRAVKCIRWEGAWCRKDISDKARSSM